MEDYLRNLKEDALAVLVLARNVLDIGGWRQGSYGVMSDPDGPHCAVGCIEVAGYDLYTADAYMVLAVAKKQLAKQLIKKSVVDYNDTTGRTKEEIEKLFEKAIAELEAELE